MKINKNWIISILVILSVTSFILYTIYKPEPRIWLTVDCWDYVQFVHEWATIVAVWEWVVEPYSIKEIDGTITEFEESTETLYIISSWDYITYEYKPIYAVLLPNWELHGVWDYPKEIRRKFNDEKIIPAELCTIQEPSYLRYKDMFDNYNR